MLTGVFHHISLLRSLDWRYMTILSMKRVRVDIFLFSFEDHSTSFKVKESNNIQSSCIDILRTRFGMSPGMALGFFWALGGLFFQGLFLSFQRYLTSCRRTKRIIPIFSRPCQGGSTYRRPIRNFQRKMVCIHLLTNTLYQYNRRWRIVALKCFSARWFPVSIMYTSGQICAFLIKLASMAIAPVIGNVAWLFVHKSHPNWISGCIPISPIYTPL